MDWGYITRYSDWRLAPCMCNGLSVSTATQPVSRCKSQRQIFICWPRSRALDGLTLKKESLRPFETSGNTRPTTQRQSQPVMLLPTYSSTRFLRLTIRYEILRMLTFGLLKFRVCRNVTPLFRNAGTCLPKFAASYPECS